MLELPVTIRLPRRGEMRHRTDLDELLEKRKEAQIVQGYDMKDNKTPQLPYNFYAAINVHNSKLWEVFLSLTEAFTDDAKAVYSLNELHIATSAAMSTSAIVKTFSTFKTELTQDGNIAFGLLYHTKQSLIELTVTESKYIKFWGKDKAAFITCMASFSIPQRPGLEFIDEYPKIVEPLSRFIPSSRKPEDVIKALDKAFNVQR